MEDNKNEIINEAGSEEQNVTESEDSARELLASGEELEFKTDTVRELPAESTEEETPPPTKKPTKIIYIAAALILTAVITIIAIPKKSDIIINAPDIDDSKFDTVTITFDTAGGPPIGPMHFQKGELIPELEVIRPGYDFVGWDYDFSKPVTGSFMITAIWRARDDTPYTVEHYLEDRDGGFVEMYYDEHFVGTTDTQVNGAPLVFDNYVFDEALSDHEGNINADGSLVLRLLYTRKLYTVSSSDERYGAVEGAGEYKYDLHSTTIEARAYLGCRFAGWYEGDELRSTDSKLEYSATENLRAVFLPEDSLANLEFFSSAEECTVTGVKNKNVTSLTVPDCVTSIEEGALSGLKNLTEITLPFIGKQRESVDNDSVKYPLGYVFGQDKYDSSYTIDFEIPEGNGVSSLYSYYVPDSLRTVTVTGGGIFEGSFKHSHLISIVIEAGVDYVSGGAFERCSSLTDIIAVSNTRYKTVDGSLYSRNGETLVSYAPGRGNSEFLVPDGTTVIGYAAFRSCTSLVSITLPDSLSEIEDRAFEGCHRLFEVVNHSSLDITGDPYMNGGVGFFASKIHNSESLLSRLDGFIFYDGGYEGERYLLGYEGELTSFVLPESIGGEKYSVYDYAFAYNGSITNVAIPAGITQLGIFAFSDCTSLETVTVESRLVKIGECAFAGCTLLRNIALPEGLKTVGGGAFMHCPSLSVIVLPNSVTSLGESAFSNCIGLTDVVLSEALTEIGNSTFFNCKSLNNVTVPGNIKTVGNQAFAYCENLESVTLMEGVEGVYDFAFDGCARLSRIVLPDSLIAIESRAFMNCDSLSSVDIPKGVRVIGDGAFADCDFLNEIRVDEKNTSYKSVGGVLYNADSSILVQYPMGRTDETFAVPEGVLIVGGYAFSNNDYLKTVILPVGLRAVSASAFENCDGIIEISIPETVTYIGSYAFAYCKSLECIAIPYGIEAIEDRTFMSCSSLCEIEIPKTVIFFGNSAFEYCTELSSIVYGGSENDWEMINKSAGWDGYTNDYTVTFKNSWNIFLQPEEVHDYGR